MCTNDECTFIGSQGCECRQLMPVAADIKRLIIEGFEGLWLLVGRHKLMLVRLAGCYCTCTTTSRMAVRLLNGAS